MVQGNCYKSLKDKEDLQRGETPWIRSQNLPRQIKSSMRKPITQSSSPSEDRHFRGCEPTLHNYTVLATGFIGEGLARYWVPSVDKANRHKAAPRHVFNSAGLVRHVETRS